MSKNSKSSQNFLAIPKNKSSNKQNDNLNNSSNHHYSSNATTAVPSPNPPLQTGLSPGEALAKYKDELTMFEKTELMQFEEIYTVGSFRRQALSEIADAEGYYRVRVGE